MLSKKIGMEKKYSSRDASAGGRIDSRRDFVVVVEGLAAGAAGGCKHTDVVATGCGVDDEASNTGGDDDAEQAKGKERSACIADGSNCGGGSAVDEGQRIVEEDQQIVDVFGEAGDDAGRRSSFDRVDRTDSGGHYLARHSSGDHYCE